MFRTILLGLDGSPESQKALEYARELARDQGSRIEVVHVREIVLAGRGGVVTANADEDEVIAAVKAQVAALGETVTDVHLSVVTTTLGGPAHVLADHARGVDADVIVVGTRGRSKVTGLLLGSVTQRLLQIAPCAVLAIPPKMAGGTGSATAAAAATAGV